MKKAFGLIAMTLCFSVTLQAFGKSLPISCRNALSDLAKADKIKNFSLQWINLPTGEHSVVLKRLVAAGKAKSPTLETERELFLTTLAQIDRLLVKDTCPKEFFEIVFVYPDVSYAISGTQLAAIRKFKTKSPAWSDQLVMRLSVARL